MPFAVDYFLLSLVSACGVIQMAAFKANLRGLFFIPSARLNFLGALAITVLAFIWFFASEPRNLPDTGDGINGNQQALLFLGGVLAGTLLTFLLSSFFNRSRFHSRIQYRNGIEALTCATFVQALKFSLKRLWKL